MTKVGRGAVPVRQRQVYQDPINKTYGTKFNIPVVYYSTLMSVAFGRSAKDAALYGQMMCHAARCSD